MLPITITHVNVDRNILEDKQHAPQPTLILNVLIFTGIYMIPCMCLFSLQQLEFEVAVTSLPTEL